MVSKKYSVSDSLKNGAGLSYIKNRNSWGKEIFNE